MNNQQQTLWQRGVAQAKEVARAIREFFARIFPPLRTKPQKDEAERERREQEREKQRRKERGHTRGQTRGQTQCHEPGPGLDGLDIGGRGGQEPGVEPEPVGPGRGDLREAINALMEEAQTADPVEDLLEMRRRLLGEMEGRDRGPRPSAAPTDQAEQVAADIRQDIVEVLEGELGGGFGSSGGGPFHVHYHPLGGSKNAVRGPTGPADKGMAITRFERLAVDGLVFDRKRPGGSVLIDQSGSMHLTKAEVVAALETLPALTMAGYVGHPGTPMLCVLAQRGLTGELDDFGGKPRGNDIDIEALAWLAKQPAPRIWVSDGQVCGGLVDVLGAEQAHDFITSLCQRKGIVRVNTFEEAVAVLQRGITRGVAVEPRDADFLPGLSPSLDR